MANATRARRVPAKRHILDRLADKFTVGDGCWEWTASKDRLGYGDIGYNGRVVKAHRLVYEVFVGPIPDGLEIDHLCRNRGCVRPDHLEPVTHTENMRRADNCQSRKTHCPRGHEYNDTNTYLARDGSRHCRACWPIRQRIRSQSQ